MSEREGSDDDALVELLAHGRRDLASETDRTRADDDEVLLDAVARSKDESRELSVALRRAVPSADVDDLVAAAMRHADAPTPSRRSLRIGAALGTLALTGSLALSLVLDGTATIERAQRLLRATLTLGGAAERAVAMLPGQGNTLSIAAAAALFVLAVLFRLVDRGRLLRAGGAIAPFVLAATLGVGTAHAYEIEGACGTTPVRVSVDRAPRSVALRQALASGGLGLAYALPDDPPVSVHVGRAPLSHVLGALLGGAPVRVRCTGSIVAVEPMTWTTPAPVPPPVIGGTWRLSSTTATPSPVLRDVLTFGGDALVAAIDDVRDVVTMGGDAHVAGRAYGDVVTMGGDAEISGLVVGDVFTMGGNIHVAREGSVHGRLDAMGGEVVDERMGGGMAAPPPLALMGGPTPMAGCAPTPHGVADFLGSGARHALLFLFGLLFLGLAPKRLRAISNVLVDRPGRATFAGALGAVGLPILCVALIITLVGIPVAAVVAFLGVIAGLAGLVAASMVIGAAIPWRRLSGRPVAQLAVGTVVLFLVSQVPWVGGVAWLLALVAGLGAFVLTRAGGREVT